jgi:RimJ/RimL family protein N-acetyltransferase
MTPADGESAYLLNSDPDVIRYTGDRAFESIEQASEFLAKYDHYSKYGFGRWAVINKNTHAFVGWCGLKYTADKKEFDIGYRLHKKFWNMGFATESATPCISLGFEKFNMPSIVGRAMKQNGASIRVLEKIGLKYWKDDLCDGKDGVIYKIDR